MAYPAALCSNAETYLENFLECLKGAEAASGLPNDLQRKFALIHELDSRCEEVKAQLDTLTEDYLRLASHHRGGGKSGAGLSAEQLASMRQLQYKAYHFSNEKVILCDQASFIVNSYLKRLEVDLAAFEEESGGELLTEIDVPVRKKFKKGKSPPRESSSISAEASQTPVRPAPSSGPLPSSDEIFCMCRQVSFGEMVACDDELCRLKWFHFGCVGLKKEPKGKWFCPECSVRRKE